MWRLINNGKGKRNKTAHNRNNLIEISRLEKFGDILAIKCDLQSITLKCSMAVSPISRVLIRN